MLHGGRNERVRGDEQGAGRNAPSRERLVAYRSMEDNVPPAAIEWIFDGIGTAIVSLVVGLITGGLGGWSLHKRHIRVSLRAGDGAHQTVSIDSRDRGAK